MDSKDVNINIQNADIIKSKRRGDILYYSVSQVAALLGEDDRNIRYYTNVFDNILKIEIANKELRYTIKDIDKLEFLINLKNKGMTVKQIQKYCEELPLDNEDSTDIKETNQVSFEEMIKSVTDSENKQIENLSDHLTNKIDYVNECLGNKVDESCKLAVEEINTNNKLAFEKIAEGNTFDAEKIAELIIDNQNKQLTIFKEDIIKELKEYVDHNLDTEYKTNNDLYNKILEINNLVSEKLSLQDNIQLELDKFTDLCLSRDKSLLDEIRRFKNVMEQAYYMQQEVDVQKKSVGFLQKLFGSSSKY